MSRSSIGELEHLILLAVLSLGRDASALRVREELASLDRKVSRGALYRSLDRLEEKGPCAWSLADPGAHRGGHAKRIYAVTDVGRDVVRERRSTLERLWVQAREALEA